MAIKNSYKADRRFPTCIFPVGLGAYLVLTLLIVFSPFQRSAICTAVLLQNGQRCKWPNTFLFFCRILLYAKRKSLSTVFVLGELRGLICWGSFLQTPLALREARSGTKLMRRVPLAFAKCRRTSMGLAERAPANELCIAKTPEKQICVGFVCRCTNADRKSTRLNSSHA